MVQSTKPWQCPHCGNKNPPDSMWCRHCDEDSDFFDAWRAFEAVTAKHYIGDYNDVRTN